MSAVSKHSRRLFRVRVMVLLEPLDLRECWFPVPLTPPIGFDFVLFFAHKLIYPVFLTLNSRRSVIVVITIRKPFLNMIVSPLPAHARVYIRAPVLEGLL